jgi:hypothetical protein
MNTVLMTHPKVQGYALVSRDAYDIAYQSKGWILVDEDKVTRDDLVRLAASKGVDVPDAWTKAQIIDSLKG